MKPENIEDRVRRSFNGFCKKTLMNEARNAHKEFDRRMLKEVNFSDLHIDEETLIGSNPLEMKEVQDYKFNGKRMTLELLSEAINCLENDLRIVIEMYYLLDFNNDKKISELFDIPRSTVQNRRSRALIRLKNYLEEKADDWEDI